MVGESLFIVHTLYWFFRRKAKIAFFTLMVYAALC